MSQVERFSHSGKAYVVLAALHSHQDLAARQSANRLLHDADARGLSMKYP